jgi:hypothetical protein
MSQTFVITLKNNETGHMKTTVTFTKLIHFIQMAKYTTLFQHLETIFKFESDTKLNMRLVAYIHVFIPETANHVMKDEASY